MYSFAIWINVIYCSHYHALEMCCVQAVLFQVMVLQRRLLLQNYVASLFWCCYFTGFVFFMCNSAFL